MAKLVPDHLPNDLLWGVSAIAAYIRRERRQTYYLISTGKIPAKKLGPKTIVGRKSEIDDALAQGDAPMRPVDAAKVPVRKRLADVDT